MSAADGVAAGGAEQISAALHSTVSVGVSEDILGFLFPVVAWLGAWLTAPGLLLAGGVCSMSDSRYNIVGEQEVLEKQGSWFDAARSAVAARQSIPLAQRQWQCLHTLQNIAWSLAANA